MKKLLWPAISIVLIGVGIAGEVGVAPSLSAAALPFMILGGLILAFIALRPTFYRSGTAWPQAFNEPRPLRLRWIDYPKALICWLGGFSRTYVLEPGLYYTGDTHRPDAPTLVTANYHLSVFLVLRHLRKTNVRLLVIDTDGINVWCAAGKGAFGNRAIHAQLQRYPREILTRTTWLTLILPKFGMAGVDIRKLREHKIKPVVGPLYAKDLAGYLASPPYRDRAEDVVRFGLQMRAFTWLPGLVQFLGYGVLLILVLSGVHWLFGVSLPLGLLSLIAIIATGYPILFPVLPGVRFAVKGLSLATAISVLLAAAAALAWLPLGDAITAVLFTFATSIFFGLSYTGNSAVSAYTRVRKETAQFLVPSVLLYLASLAAFAVTEVLT